MQLAVIWLKGVIDIRGVDPSPMHQEGEVAKYLVLETSIHICLPSSHAIIRTTPKTPPRRCN